MSLEAYRQKREADKRASIIHAARRLFSENAFRDVTTATLAAEGGVSTATLYRYFTDKETLFDAVIEEFVDSIHATLRSFENQHTDGLYALAITYGKLLGDPEFIGLMRVVVAEAGESTSFKTKIETADYELFNSAFEREIRARLPAETTDSQIEQASIELSAMISAQTLLRGLMFNEFSSEAEIEAIVLKALESWRASWLVEN
ncbi:MAG: TetR/AcrR family transcriptional regulator [Gammaproteobacteria bacterium]